LTDCRPKCVIFIAGMILMRSFSAFVVGLLWLYYYQYVKLCFFQRGCVCTMW